MHTRISILFVSTLQYRLQTIGTTQLLLQLAQRLTYWHKWEKKKKSLPPQADAYFCPNACSPVTPPAALGDCFLRGAGPGLRSRSVHAQV